MPKGTGKTLLASLATVPAERRASWRMHKVEGGETLAAIGKRYGAAAGSIAAVNNLASTNPVAGERLLIPAAAKTAARKVTSARRTTSSARRTTSSKSRSSYAKSKRPAAKPATTRASARPSTAPAKKAPPVLARTATAGSRSSASSN